MSRPASWRNRLAAPLAALLIASSANAAKTAGWVEPVFLGPQRVPLQAKLDTGADTASLHAAYPRYFSRDGVDWVQLEIGAGSARPVILERPILRYVTIRRHFGAVQRRPVIRLEVCVGGVTRTIEANLVDRSGLDYPLLLGRSALADEFVVDPSRTHLTDPAACRPNPD